MLTTSIAVLCILLGLANAFFLIKPYKEPIKVKRFQHFFGKFVGTAFYTILYVAFPVYAGVFLIK